MTRSAIAIAGLGLIGALFAPDVSAIQLVGEGKLYIRFTNNRPDNASIIVRVNIKPLSNYKEFVGDTLYVGADKFGEDKPRDMDRGLSAGASLP